jgi:hypothetical protein
MLGRIFLPLLNGKASTGIHISGGFSIEEREDKSSLMLQGWKYP